MQKINLTKNNLPDVPGVYLFYKRVGTRKKILYVGKATSLRDRVRSYFDDDLIVTRGPRLVDMVTQADGIMHEVTPTVLEALVREAALIKLYHPPANVEGKDDKSFLYCIITKEEVPRVLLVRGKDIDAKSSSSPYGKYTDIYGPFPSGTQLKEALRIIRKIFPFYDSQRPVSDALVSKHTKAKLEFDKQIEKAPRVLEVRAYQKSLRRVKLFIGGKTKELRVLLKREMKDAVERLAFEEAHSLKRQLFALDHINDVSLIRKEGDEGTSVRRLEAFDVAHLSGTNAVGVMVVYENGVQQKKEYRTFKIKGVKKNDDIASLREVLVRRFSHAEWEYPTAIVIDGGKTHRDVAKRIMSEFGLPIPVVSVVKNERHHARDVLNASGKDALPESYVVRANAEAHRFALATHRKLRGKLKK